jgi:C-terminal processing protease CtpA/Prc
MGKARFPLHQISALVFFFVIAVATALTVVAGSYRSASLEVCHLFAENYYRINESQALKFARECVARAESDPFLPSRNANAERINSRLQTLKVSHLSLYSPAEIRAVWENIEFKTGLKTRIIEDKLIVFDIVPDSAAERAGFKAGDVIVAKDGDERLSVSDVEEAPERMARYMIERAGKRREISMMPSEVTEDLSPRVRRLRPGISLLRLESFLPQYFDGEKWKRLVEKFKDERLVIVDLRGNAGGSFPAMLRALSPFRCDAREIGALVRSRSSLPDDERKGVEDLRDDLDASRQIEQLSRASAIQLKSFKDYGCFWGKIIVLIDGETSSVAEIFAEALRARPRSRVWGQRSAGLVVVAEWFPIVGLGRPEFSLSLPIAASVVFDLHGEAHDLEGEGVRPERALFYDLKTEMSGLDTWIEAALRR